MLHIVNGDIVANKLKQSGIQGEILVWREIYSCGPLFEHMEDEVNSSVRAEALERQLGIPAGEYMAQCRSQELVLKRLGAFDEVVLWFEHDLFDQTILAYLLHWFQQNETARVKLNLLSIGSYPGIQLFRGLGQLSLPELQALSGTWHLLSRDELELGSAWWRAYISSNPSELAQLLEKTEEETSILPFAKKAFTAHLSRLPSFQNGLGCVEQEVLAALKSGGRGPHSLFREVGDRLYLLGMGDLEFWSILKRMAAGSAPVLQLAGSDRFPDYQFIPAGFKEAVLTITEQGEKVLGGSVHYMQDLTEEVWYGGIPLHGEVKWGFDRVTESLVKLK
ncbi:hypothetical protein BK126_08415 [Paenibacillus sp. FSL H7-0326]|uniref:DUF1835 domain-containing protein n=1 Tax=Paenibacillus sp. FSL H7-0326 TaxID=1921144 RepID=UPI00096EE3FC|nr:DUF1835 domain-containing protein [Paenibacillus sp. FSL H7-0326]OMC72030.1 hypothetical protein BK126_08415 [Paenibacillus sp. FSL H7-0326]